MVKNRAELIKVAEDNANQLKTNLRAAISAFIKAHKITAKDLAYVLGITDGEMRQLLSGDGNVTVNVLSKLLVATDMAVEIKPIGATPLGCYGKRMPKSGGFPGAPMGIPVGRDGMPLPPPGFMPPHMMDNVPETEEVPMETEGPARDSRGRFVKRKPATNSVRRAQPVTEANPYFNMNREELIDIIQQNIWDSEIDLTRASRDTLAEFVTEKERLMKERAERKNNPAPAEELKNPIEGGSNDAVAKFFEVLGNMAKEAENNPHLAEVISRFMRK